MCLSYRNIGALYWQRISFSSIPFSLHDLELKNSLSSKKQVGKENNVVTGTKRERFIKIYCFSSKFWNNDEFKYFVIIGSITFPTNR